MNSCDGGHYTADEIRRLPLGGGAGAFVCRRCYAAEADQSGRLDAPPSWTDLPVAALSFRDVDRVEALAGEAAMVGDSRQVDLCRLAIEGDMGAIKECLSVLTEEADRKRSNSR